MKLPFLLLLGLSVAIQSAATTSAATTSNQKAASSNASSAGGGTARLDTVVALGELCVEGVSISAIKATSPLAFPAAQTVVGATEIEQLDINGIKGAAELSPNFFMPEYGSRMTSTIYVRGLGTRIDQPVVAMNVDNVQILNKDNFDFSFPDMDRIEIVRGPQSILYGRNSMGGVVNITTISPLKYQGVRALVEGGSGNTWRASASAYFKPSATVGVGVIASMNSTDGFYRNLHSGKKVDSERQGITKLKFSWQPSRRFILENSAWVTQLRQGGYPYEFVETGEINHNDTCFYRRTTVIDGLTMSYFGNNFSIASVTGFQYHNDNMTLDQDFLPQDYFTMSQKRHEWSLTQDFIIKGRKQRYSWLSGLYGFYRRYNMHAPVTFGDYGIASLIEQNINSQLPAGMLLQWDERSLLLDSRFRSPIWGWALYHKSEYTAGKFRGSVGLRLAFERTTLGYDCNAATSATMYRMAGPALIPLKTVPIEISLADRLHTTSLQLLPEFKLSYMPTANSAIGIVVSKGYKAGGFNTQMFSDILQREMMSSGMPGAMASPDDYDPDQLISYKPETSWNYELDAELHLRNLDLNLATFYIDCRNQQMTVFPDENYTGRMMANAGRTRSIGVELSANYSPIDRLTLSAAYGLADARFRKFNDGKADYKGKHVPYAPENTLFASAAYTFGLNGGFVRSITPIITCRGAGRIYWEESNTLSQPFYAQLGARVAVHTDYADLELWGENLSNTRFSTFYFESIGHSFTQRGNPRRFGVTLRFNLDFKQ